MPNKVQALNIHVFQHVDFEDIGYIHDWILENGHNLSYTKFYEKCDLPNIDNIDWLIIMGGPMSVGDEAKFHWLANEKKFILKAIKANKKVLGICLGAQLLASVLGANVKTNKQKEIGWFPLFKTDDGKNSKLLRDFSDITWAFHWHGDTFDIPANTQNLLYSDVCKHQAFSNGKNIIGLQFHLEVTKQLLVSMLQNGNAELQIPSDSIQTAVEINASSHYIAECNLKMKTILEFLQNDNI